MALLFYVNVGDVAEVPKVHATSIFRAEMCRLKNVCVHMALCFENQLDKVGERA
jgi:hypothetical protein